jgi:hypothetical protein
MRRNRRGMFENRPMGMLRESVYLQKQNEGEAPRGAPPEM